MESRYTGVPDPMAEPDDDLLLHHLAYLAGLNLWWAFMKPVAIRRLVSEIDLGVALYVEEHRLLWEEFPIEMDILFRMRLEKRAIIRPV